MAPEAGGLLRRRGTQRGRHLFATQRFALALLRHLESELVVDAVVARSHIPVPDHAAGSATQGRRLNPPDYDSATALQKTLTCQRSTVV